MESPSEDAGVFSIIRNASEVISAVVLIVRLDDGFNITGLLEIPDIMKLTGSGRHLHVVPRGRPHLGAS
jgi:hypothetical protein